MAKPSQVLSLAALAAWSAVVLLLLCAAAPRGADALTCNPTRLAPCAVAFTGNSPPTAECCSSLKEQQPCLCAYARNPKLQRYVNWPDSKNAMAACKVPVPSC